MRHYGGAIAAAFLLVVVGAGLVSAADPAPIAAPAFTTEYIATVLPGKGAATAAKP